MTRSSIRLAQSLVTVGALVASLSLGDVFAQQPPATPTGNGVIRGAVVNGAKDNAPVTDLTVTLMPVSAMGPGQRQTTQLSSDGAFQFTGLSTAPGQSYVLWTEYQGARYQLEPMRFDSTSAERVVTLTVFEATTTDPGIAITRNTIVILPQPSDKTLGVLEMIEANNPSKSTYVGKPQPGLPPDRPVSLMSSWPKGSGNLQILQGIHVNGLATTDRFYGSSLPMTPGTTNIMAQYTVDYTERTATFAKTILYPTSEFHVLVADGRWTMSGPANLVYRGDIEESGRKFRVYTANNLTPDQPIQLAITGDGLAPTFWDELPVLPGLIGAIVLFGIVGGAAVPILRRRRHPVARKRRATTP
ncbi:MAG: hypothetical protein NZ518_03175, partial [Dehalococcoidia bacterium]|nr:hypothetical protein [Dehalococcoidia bacterium]